MQEWIVAMLVISILLIVRDMAKTIFSGRKMKTEETQIFTENHPQKEKVQRYAASFQKLADTFYGMPYRKDYLSSGQIQKILEDAGEQVCGKCYQRELCWGENASEMLRGTEALIRTMEEGDEEELRRIRGEWSGVCSRPLPYIQAIQEGFYREKQNLIWDNRMIDNRLAVAQQLSEISRIMEMVAEDLYDISGGTPQFTEELKKH